LNADVVSAGILQPNKYLKLPTWSQTCGDPNKAGDSCRVYIVSTGDFVAGIAAAFGVSSDDILAVNPGLSAGAVLQNGQPIKIPPFPASCGAGTPTKPPTDTVIKCRGYRVSTGDNLQSIAQAFKTTVADLGDVNPELAGGALVQPGTIVKIPPYDSSCDQPVLVKLPTGNGGASPSPANASPVVPLPVPLPLFSPSPVVASPPLFVPSPIAAPVPAPAPIAAPMPAPVEAPVPAPTEAPVVVVSTPPPPSSAVSAKAAIAAVVAMIAAMAF
jgi:LysM repeat protein